MTNLRTDHLFISGRPSDTAERSIKEYQLPEPKYVGPEIEQMNHILESAENKDLIFMDELSCDCPPNETYKGHIKIRTYMKALHAEMTERGLLYIGASEEGHHAVLDNKS
jgi:hypothetical protein